MDTASGRLRRSVLAGVATALIALTLAGAAWGHAGISPAVFQTGTAGEFVLTVPTETEDATTTQVEMTPPSGFSVFAFAPSPGWKREVQATGTGEERTIRKVTWSGGSVPAGEYAEFRFTGSADDPATYAFAVRQTYSDGSVVDWSGPPDSDEPAARIEGVSDLASGGESGSNTLAIVALAVGGVGVLLGLAGLLAGGRRALA